MFTFAIVHFTDCILYVLGFVPYLIYSLLFQNKERFFCFPHKVLKFCFYLGFFFSLIYFFFFYFTILYWFCHTSTWIRHRYTRVPHPEPPSHLLPLPSLWVISMHQPQASCILHRTWTGDSFHIWYYTCFSAILPNHPTLALFHRVQKTVLYIPVSLLLSRNTGLSLPSF